MSLQKVSLSMLAEEVTSAINGAGSGASGYTAKAFHGFIRDSEGRLIYDKVVMSTNARIYLTDGTTFDDTPNDTEKNPGETYDQWLLDSDQVNFYIDDDGFLVARVFESYTYSGPK